MSLLKRRLVDCVNVAHDALRMFWSEHLRNNGMRKIFDDTMMLHMLQAAAHNPLGGRAWGQHGQHQPHPAHDSHRGAVQNQAGSQLPAQLTACIRSHGSRDCRNVGGVLTQMWGM